MPLNIYFWKMCALFPAYFGKDVRLISCLFRPPCPAHGRCRTRFRAAPAFGGNKAAHGFIRIMPVFTRIPAVFKPVPMPVRFVRIPTAKYTSPKNAKKLDLFWKISFELNFIRHNRLLLRILLSHKLFFRRFLFDRLIKLTKNSWQPYNLAV